MKLGNNKKVIYSLKTIVHFGKHKGKTIEEIINEDVNWLFWATDESVIELDNIAYATLNGCERGETDLESYYEHLND